MSVNMSRDRRPRVPITTTYKIILTDSSGRVLKVIEGTQEDPFSYDFVLLFYESMVAPSQSIFIYDVAGTELYLFTPSVPPGYGGTAVAIPYPAAILCLVNCPGTPNVSYKIKLPGIWLFSSQFSGLPAVSSNYATLITSVAYSPPSISQNVTATVGATNTIALTQNFLNNSNSPVVVAAFAVVAAFYPITSSGLTATPYFVDIAYYNLSAPFVLSPGIALTVQITFQVPT